ncbi:MAG: molybdopterin adenylyltransferase [Desulfobacterota bacterium]|nr:molybdopterin adenylyltransferase [Thermodesulfobacteriota bacterium]MDW8002508.1 molybdopterin adenylyltransferase [Deltaproteobacteria bacterium]
MKYKAAIVTVSDKGSRGEREDKSGPSVRALLEDKYLVEKIIVVPDEEETISTTIAKLIDEEGIDLVITTGGTGISPRDVTPEATKRVIEKELPGFSEIMRVESYKITPHGIISRGICGIRKKSLIINLPGSPKAAKECLSFVIDAIPHTLSKLKGSTEECGT